MEREEISFRKELSKISIARDRLLDAYQSGLLDLKELSRRSQQLDISRHDLEKKIKTIQALKMEREIGKELKESFQHILEKMQKTASELSLLEKQKLVRLFVEKIVVDENEVKITHCISPHTLNPENCQLSGDARR